MTLFLMGCAPASQKQSTFSSELKSTTVIVMPHHDILLNTFPSFYESIPLKERNQIRHLILLSPNHFQPEVNHIKTRGDDFVLRSNQTIHIQVNFLKALQASGAVIDNQVFDPEHGVQLHLPFIATYFPNATITPLLFTRNMSQSALDELEEILSTEAATQNTLFLVSTDFSHYLPYDQAEKKDQETVEYIQKNQPKKILSLSDDNLDCPGCMYVAMKIANEKNLIPSIVFHSNSAKILNLQPNDSTTSYFVMKW